MTAFPFSYTRFGEKPIFSFLENNVVFSLKFTLVEKTLSGLKGQMEMLHKPEIAYFGQRKSKIDSARHAEQESPIYYIGWLGSSQDTGSS